MNVHDVLVAEHVLDRAREVIEGLASGIRVVGPHELRELVVAHRVDAAVGQHIEENVPRSEEERVVARFSDGVQPFLRRNQV